MPGMPCPVVIPASKGHSVPETNGVEAAHEQPKGLPRALSSDPITVTTVHKAASEADMAMLNNLLAASKAAQSQYAKFTQAQVDEIFKCAALAANDQRLPLAKMAVEETGMGMVEDKVIKNHFASEFIYNKYKNEKTCDVIEVDPQGGFTKVAEPMGVIAGVVPTTNPTSTAIFKSLLALKTRNSLVLCPHPRARKCTIEAARIVRDAAVAAGAPEDIISWIEQPSLLVSQALMQSPQVSLILATGGPQMVKAAYSSGNPALGVGAGNTPAVIDETADVEMAVSSVLLSKTFDHGVICASEQSVVVVDSQYDAVKAEFVRRGAYFLKNEEEKDKVRSKLLIDGRLNADIVGQSAQKLAQIFGIEVPEWTRVIIGEADIIGKEEALSQEKLCPVLAMYRASNFHDAVEKADRLVMLFGAGHTSVLYTSPLNREHIQKFTLAMKTVRVLVNQPASQGAIGDLYNFHLDPSLTLGCGSWGSTSVSANVGPKNLLNIKSCIERRENMLWFRVPPKIYFKGGCMEVALAELKGKQRAFVVTDKPLYDLGYADQVTHILDRHNIHHQTFYRVAPDPTLACIEDGLSELREFRPDVIIALGGGSPMDAAKVMWLMYECPEIDFRGLAVRFMDIRKRVYEVPELGKKALMVCIPTTSGTGSEVTPFAVVTDEKTGIKYPLADYALTPHMAIVDPQLVIHMPKTLTAFGGIDALVHSLESYVSVFATDYTKGLSREAVSILFKFLPRAYANGNRDLEARERVHSAATIAGMAFANAFLGICHSLAHKLGSAFHIPHGMANAALITHVIRYNATDRPMKMAVFPQYQYPQAKDRYAELSDMLGLGGTTPDQKVMHLIEAVEALKAKIGIPATIREIVGADKETEFMDVLDTIADMAFDDQCTGANPRYPLISDLKQILKDAWGAPILPNDGRLKALRRFPTYLTAEVLSGAHVTHPVAATPSRRSFEGNEFTAPAASPPISPLRSLA
ncbi:bifunctional acetaldehyde-alcohol dehydrogenase [Micractinium conductrix]|uniref:alcohol dehydrogenase n=1 Tax=Micractinium conductrix TaxID=554055 RepID=A0A2P6V3A9_9CHLO|nr:bifunctional acetaldehyde-alcohol dehydrogenase [Micractinium conductrix]|eukprot:PSC68567.1 bifunctional acetaldehyde-alcohol dehydrogenase [Micractinium conductrix]